MGSTADNCCGQVSSDASSRSLVPAVRGPRPPPGGGRPSPVGPGIANCRAPVPTAPSVRTGLLAVADGWALVGVSGGCCGVGVRGLKDFAKEQVEVALAGAVVTQAGAQNRAVVNSDGGEVGASGGLDAVGDAGV